MNYPDPKGAGILVDRINLPILTIIHQKKLENSLYCVESETCVTYSYPFCSNKEKEVFIEDARDYIATQISIELDVLKIDLDKLYEAVSD